MATSPASAPSSPSRSLALRVAALALIVATVAAYYWGAFVFFDHGYPIGEPQGDHFNLLSRGFLKGHLYLDAEVPRAIREAANPYDPAQIPQGTSVLHDASYYQGKYYIYFGPAPVITLLLPYHAFTGHDLPLPYAVWVFSSLGYLGLVALFFFLQRTYFPAARPIPLFACLLALGSVTMVFSLLRRPNVWELSVAAGFAFFILSLLCLVRALTSSRAALWSGLGGLLLGLAVASRPTYLVGCLLFALPLAAHRPSATRYGWRALLSAATTCGAIGVGLLAYNYARFGSALEFGQKYQLSSVIEGDLRHFGADFVPFNVLVYFLTPLQWRGSFPFADAIILPPTPPGFGGYEYAFGLIPNLPFILFALVLPCFVLIPRLRRAWPAPFWLASVVITAGAGLLTAVLLGYFGTCVRYMVDFTPSILLLACLGVLALDSRFAAGLARGFFQSVTAGLALFSASVAFLATVNVHTLTPDTPPSPYAPVARVFNAPVHLVDHLRWSDYRPWEVSIAFPADRRRREESLLTVTKYSQPSAVLFVDYVDEHSVRFGYRESHISAVTLYSPSLPAEPHATHNLRIQIGDTTAPAVDGVKSWLRVHYDGRPVWELPVVSLSAFPGAIATGAAARGVTGRPAFTGQVFAAAPATSAPPAAPRFLGARVRLNLDVGMIGHSYPLAATGVAGFGNNLFFRVTGPDTVVFGYDHWGAPSSTIDPVTVRFGEPHLVEFWLPVVSPTPAPNGHDAELHLRLDGRTLWREPKPFYPATAVQIFPGINPIGCSSSERVLPNGVFEATDLPFPPL